ncbi:HEAT repeat domain-containing protein [Candidatus Uabimicrobium amorphum]|uniref:Uncharacterized protein n=1 Tax=Uabimicrobium amorphum TaxID=2596890 RepID=A0A5S9IJ79_UABAM|nr:HEAT repeat domain-containing protein [Candidatus Uabimicrobium amorphum]BBM82547.1 hypothetical protein UABAM_00890 [Candidatus Uabimicrobium amorphum]
MSLDRDKIKKKRSSSTSRTSSRTSATAKPRVKTGKVPASGKRKSTGTTPRMKSSTTGEKRVAKKATRPVKQARPPKKAKPAKKAKPVKVKQEKAPKVRQPKPPKPPRKIKFPKLGIKKREKKMKGRVYRSVKERSLIPLLVLLLIVGGGVGFTYWYDSQAPIRLVGDLKNFDIPEDLQNFDPRNDPVLVPILREGEGCLPELIKKYPAMKENEKIGTLALIRYFKNEESMKILSPALLSKDERLKTLAATAAGFMEEKAVATLREDLKKTSGEQQQYIINALGQTKTPEALNILLEEVDKEISAEKKIYIIEALSNYTEQKAAEGIIKLGVDKNRDVVQKATYILEIHRQNQVLHPYASALVEMVDSKLIDSQSAVERARIIDIIGVIGKCTKPSGDNYVNRFRGSIRKLLNNDNEEEKAAAARTLGVFGDDQYIDRLFKLLRHKSELVATSAAEALVKIGDSEIPTKVLENSFVDSNSKVILTLTAKLLNEYYLYLLKDQKIQETVEQIFRVMHRHKTNQKIAGEYFELLFRYTETSPFKMSTKDSKLLVALIKKTPTPPKKKKRNKPLTRAEREREESRTLTKREKLFVIIERYMKHSPQEGNLKLFISGFNQMQDGDAKERLHKALEEYRKKCRACHQQKPVEANTKSWQNWYTTMQKVDSFIAKADEKIAQAKPLMVNKLKADLEKAEKLLKSAQKMYQDIEEKTQFKFTQKMEDISTLLYETKKARGIK